MKVILFLFLMLTVKAGLSQEKKTYSIRTIAFYNVENLFDTENDSLTFDDDRTPGGKDQWTNDRYEKKIANISKVLSEIGVGISKTSPDIIGLCEVENKSVVEDLIHHENLNDKNYGVIHFDSPDERGIDVALLYNPLHFVPDTSYVIELPLYNGEERKYTRDILFVKGMLDGEEMGFFVNHWPSRRGGQEASEPKRLQAATVLRTKIDSILIRDQNAKIVSMGDFNDYPNNNSMTEVMNCEPGANHQLTNLTHRFHEDGIGTYNYRGEWGMLDQFIVSDGLLYSQKGCAASDSNVVVFKEDWMLYFPKEGEPSPSKTYGGPNYYGGYSDHLPIRMTLYCN